MESFIQDVRFGARLFWKDKGFATTAIATLAVCIAANTAIFSVVHAVVLKPLPLSEPDRLLILYNSYPNVGVKRAENGVPDFYDRRRAVTALEDVALYVDQGLNVGDGASVQRLEGMGVTPSLFLLLRAQPVLGRIFTEEEGEIGSGLHRLQAGGRRRPRLSGGRLSRRSRELLRYPGEVTRVGSTCIYRRRGQTGSTLPAAESPPVTVGRGPAMGCACSEATHRHSEASDHLENHSGVRSLGRLRLCLGRVHRSVRVVGW